MQKILAGGEKPSVRKILKLTGGSSGTIARLKQEILADKAPPLHSEEALAGFLDVWRKASREGAAEQAQALEEMGQDYASTLDENERLEGQLIAAETRIERQQKQAEELQFQLTEAQAQATQARAHSEGDARQLAETLARLSALQDQYADECARLRAESASEGARLRAELAEALEKLHASEVREAGILSEKEGMKTQVAMAESTHRQAEEKRNRLEAELQTASAQMVEARGTISELSHKLTEATSRLSELQERHAVELPALRTELATSIARCHATELQLAHLQGQVDRVEPCAKKNTPKATAAPKHDLFNQQQPEE